MEKHEDDTEQDRHISPTKLEKDHCSHMERQGIKRRSTSMYWTETTAGHRRGKEIPVCGSCHADGTRTPSPLRNWVDTSWRQKKKRLTKEDLAINI